MKVIAIRATGQHEERDMSLSIETSNDAYGPNFRLQDQHSGITIICMPDVREMDALSVLFNRRR